MARDLLLRGDVRVKQRSPWAVLGLSLITIGIYFVVWWYMINRELRDYGRAVPVEGEDRLDCDPVLSVLAVTVGALVIVPPFVSAYRTGARIREAQRRAAIEAEAMPALGLLLYLLLQIVVGAYYQSQLNVLWRAEEHRTGAAPS